MTFIVNIQKVRQSVIYNWADNRVNSDILEAIFNVKIFYECIRNVFVCSKCSEGVQ